MELYFSYDGEIYRVWRNDWGSDQFEVMGRDNFDMVKWVCERFNIQLINKTGKD